MGARERILETASRLFYEQGYHATGINQIIEEASIAKSSLYQHFKTKDDLLIAYLTIAEKDWFEGLKKEIGKNDSPENRLLSLFDYRMKIMGVKKFKGCIFVRLAYELQNTDGKAAELIRNYKKKVKAYIREAVELLNNNKDQEGKDQLANTIYYLVEGSGVESSIYRSPKPIDDAKKVVSTLIV